MTILTVMRRMIRTSIIIRNGHRNLINHQKMKNQQNRKKLLHLLHRIHNSIFPPEQITNKTNFLLKLYYKMAMMAYVFLMSLCSPPYLLRGPYLYCLNVPLVKSLFICYRSVFLLPPPAVVLLSTITLRGRFPFRSIASMFPLPLLTLLPVLLHMMIYIWVTNGRRA